MSTMKGLRRWQRIHQEPVPGVACLAVSGRESRPEIEAMTDQEVEGELSELLNSFTSLHLVRFQGELQERAAIIGWKGNPLELPPRSCLAAARKITRRK